MSLMVYSMYINNGPQTPSVYLALFVDDNCVYARELKGGYPLKKLQRGLN
jgi:hypothetical protein